MSRQSVLILLAAALAGAVLFPGCGHEAVPTDAYEDPASIPQPTNVRVVHSARGALVTWVAPDSDFRVIEGWLVYREWPDGEIRRVTETAVSMREFEDRMEPVVGTNYYWVTALSRGGVESLASPKLSIVFEEDPPSAPENLTASPLASQIILQWNQGPEPDLAGYHLYRNGVLYITVNDPAMPVFFDFAVTRGVPYTYRVTAFDFRGHESEPSNEVSATLP